MPIEEIANLGLSLGGEAAEVGTDFTKHLAEKLIENASEHAASTLQDALSDFASSKKSKFSREEVEKLHDSIKIICQYHEQKKQ